MARMVKEELIDTSAAAQKSNPYATPSETTIPTYHPCTPCLCYLVLLHFCSRFSTLSYLLSRLFSVCYIISARDVAKRTRDVNAKKNTVEINEYEPNCNTLLSALIVLTSPSYLHVIVILDLPSLAMLLC